ncbi:MAG TPA: hypothetical protein PKM41_00145 [Deltaproteobacteria bacterium]|jgi:hypothetical protein|nr:hypothetical protein [Deltaproteobacteria bacterium]HOI07877.1 hypothetical protein [Deltaproteobacteria bacterium]
METFRDHRTHPRTLCQAHLELDCLSCRTRDRVEAEMYNMSDEGLYAEAGRTLKPGAKVIIRDVHEETEDERCRVLRGNAGIIRWARPMERGHELLFGFGIWLYYPDLAEGFESLESIRFYCDMCGHPVRIRDLKQQKGPLWMCPHCNEYFEHLPDTLEEDLDRYLVGNVL